MLPRVLLGTGILPCQPDVRVAKRGCRKLSRSQTDLSSCAWNKEKRRVGNGTVCRDVIWAGTEPGGALLVQSRGGRCDPSSCCPQGRDAGDQHIIDVVLKMMQGEGVTSTHCTSTQCVGPHWPCCPIPSHTGPSLPYRAAGGGGRQRQESRPGGSRCHGPPWTPRASGATWGARPPRTHGSSRRSWPPGCRWADRQHRTQRWAVWASVLWGKKQRLLWRLL